MTQGNQYEADLRAIDLSRFINRHRNIHEAMYHIQSHDDDEGRGRGRLLAGHMTEGQNYESVHPIADSILGHDLFK